MLPTGYATDFVADSSLFHAMFRFVRRAQQRWPGLHVDGEPLPPDALGDWHLPEPGEDGRPSAVTFSSGRPTEDAGRAPATARTPRDRARTPSSTGPTPSRSGRSSTRSAW